MGYNTVKVMKYLDIIKEYDANAAITPGMLIELMSTGKVRAHATAEGNVQPMFALEDELQGQDINDAYAANDKVQCWIPVRGEEVYAILADGQTAVIGSELSSNGDGTLRVHVAEVESWEVSEAGSVTVYPNSIVAMALEAKDLSEGSESESSAPGVGYDKRIRVEVM